MAGSHSYEDEIPIRSRGYNRKTATLPKVVGIAIVLLLLVGGGIALAWWKFGKPFGGPVAAHINLSGLSEAREGENWTHTELREHLNKKGIKWDDELGIPSGSDWGMGHGSLLIVKFSDQRDKQNVDMITIERASSLLEAKEHAGVNKNGFSWGRFVFTPGDVRFTGVIIDNDLTKG